MPSYVDPLEALQTREQDLLRQIGVAVAAERSIPVADLQSAAQDAIAEWEAAGEEESDIRAFRSLSDLQTLFVEYQQIRSLIAEELDRRLG